jgi:hypothetical protein
VCLLVRDSAPSKKQYNPTLSLGLLCEGAGARTARRASPNWVVYHDVVRGKLPLPPLILQELVLRCS